MDLTYLFIVIFLFILAIIDLSVGVSNDAVNFLSSAVGSKAAKLKHILIVAAIGIFLGAAFSNGMMEIARHGMFQPEYFYFNEIMCIFLAVVISDVFLLDLFNSLGLPTSTTVSMVFELLGASFVTALIKLSGNCAHLNIADLLNTEKALTIIISIFLSVAIAFVFGIVVQWLSRLTFTFHYRKHLGRKIGIFGGVATTAILYFMLIKGLKGTTLIPSDILGWINENTPILILGSFIFFTVLMQFLHWCKVNVFKVIVLIGTFSLAMAFAGNDLVNFIGVTLAGFSSFMDFTDNGGGLAPDEFLMGSLNEPATTPLYFLIGAGAVMVFALYTSKKARKVLQTSIGLSRQNEGEEMFGSSPIARSIVRLTTNMIDNSSSNIPKGVKNWVNKRFRPLEYAPGEAVAFDLVRASVNLVLAGLLIAIGTSLKLPLSTTYVAFMVGMGTSLADRAWGRESAVYRVTGVVSVIGGWFITAGAAFLIAAFVALIMYYGGTIAMLAMIGLVIYLLINSHRRYLKKQEKEKADETMEIILKSENDEEIWNMLRKHTAQTLSNTLSFCAETYKTLFEAFSHEELRSLRQSLIRIIEEKNLMKKMRRNETKGLQRVNQAIAFERSTWYHLCTNSCQQLLNTLNRIGEPMKEHTDNSFSPLTETYIQEFSPYCRDLYHIFDEIVEIIRNDDYSNAHDVSERAKELKHNLATLRKKQTLRLHQNSAGSLRMDFVYLNLIQESHELLSEVRNLLRGSNKFFEPYNSTTVEDTKTIDISKENEEEEEH